MICKHRILWLGSYQSSEQFKNMLARNIGHASGYASQKGIIKGLDAIFDDETELDTIGVISYPQYPQYPQIRVRTEKWSRTGTSHDETIGFLNLKYITYFFRSRNLIKSVKSWSKKRIGLKDTSVIIYEPSVSKLRAALYLKEKFDAKVFVVIPDIPELVNLGANKVVKIAKKYAAMKMKTLFEKCDGFILYSACMADYYGFPDDKWILMEGVFDPDEANKVLRSEPHDTVRLMYSGALDEFRGIPQLLDAFEKLDGKYELWLTGAGRLDEHIHKLSKIDKRIHHFGYLDTREEVLELQRRADVLVHIRDINSPAAPYCFPSKLFEYLVSGKPVISVKIPGIPEEYFNYIIPIEDLTCEEIVRSIRMVDEMTTDEKQTSCEAARSFVLNKKNSIVQARKIWSFISI